MPRVMTEVDEKTQQQVLRLLNRICERAQTRFVCKLVFRQVEPDDIAIRLESWWNPEGRLYFYVAENQRNSNHPNWPETHNVLFTVCPGFRRGDIASREVDSCLRDHSLLAIIKEEMQRYGNEVQATINLALVPLRLYSF